MQFDVHGIAAYCDTGGAAFDPSLPTIVLLHGALNDHSVWAHQGAALAARGFAILAPDLPGHGRSNGPALTCIEDMADWLLALLDAAGAQRAVLAGHSMGSLIALEAAQRAPQRVAGLALLGATFPMPVADTLLESARHDVRAAIEMVVGWSHAAPAATAEPVPGSTAAAADTSPADASRRLMQSLAAASPEQLLYIDLRACNAYASGAAAAAAVTCPTVFVQGRLDKMTPPRRAAALTSAIAHAGIVEVDAGHAMMAEAPDAVLHALLALASPISQ